MLTQFEIIKVDPLRVLNFPQVAARTGYSRRQITRLLAQDAIDRCPNRRFPVPMKGTGNYRWREVSIAKWMEAR